MLMPIVKTHRSSHQIANFKSQAASLFRQAFTPKLEAAARTSAAFRHA
jgi:hypothetical protein